MDMELQRITLEGFRPVFDAMLTQEETLESIVPDACPDISRIVSATGRADLKEKGAAEGSVRLTGTARVTILYIPEGERAPRALEISVPFQCTRDQPQFHGGCLVQAAVHVARADARAINPRKVLVRVGLGLWLTVFDQERTEVCCDASDSEDAALEKRFDTCRGFAVREVSEKSFTFSDVLRPSASKPEMEELLCCRAELGAIDAKFIGRKLVLKGDIQLPVLYRSGDALISTRFELPYSQILDMGEGLEEAEPEVEVALRSVDCRLRDGELEVTLEGLAQASLRAQQSITLLSDVYCTAFPLDVERSACRVCTMAERNTRRELARQFCESGIPAKQVLDCAAAVSSMESRTAEGGMEWTAQMNVDILYLSEDDALCGVSYTIPVTGAAELPEGGACRCRCRPVGEATAVPVTGGLEVRFEAEFCWTVTREEQVQCVSAVRRGASPAAETPRPSVVVRRVCGGEALWDIAKSCGSTVRDICSANELPSEEVSAGMLLLIPTKRG